MADYIVKDTELTSVANAIRTAGGTNSLLSFPNGFVSAVGNISGGSSDFSTATVTFRMTNVGDEMAAAFDVVRVDGYSMSIMADIYDAEEQYEIVLYKGSSSIAPRGNTSITSVSGNAELSYDVVYAYGNCTVVCEGEYIG